MSARDPPSIQPTSLSPNKFPTVSSPIISLEIQGEPWTGKTATGALMPPMVAAIVTPSEIKDSVSTLKKFEEWVQPYFCESWQDIRNAVYTACKDPKVKTILVDNSSEIDGLCAEWVQEKQGVKLWSPDAGPVGYKYVYNEIDRSLVLQAIKALKNIVFTTKMKDEWKGKVPTGRRIPDSYKRVDYSFSIRLELQHGLPDPTDTDELGNLIGLKKTLTDFVFARVVKNQFMTPGFSKPYLVNSTYDGIVSDCIQPKIDEKLYTEVCREAQGRKITTPKWIGDLTDIIKEAKEYYKIT